ncbi:MAG: iron ABC transporter permease [Maledivibacter sp.]|nr:iron ABC transporter permease [Maledivibacter sp.]
MKKGRKTIFLIIPTILPIFIMFLSLFIGRYPLAFSDVIKILCSKLGYDMVGITKMQYSIIWNLRMPRAILGLMVGGSLAISGGALQGLFRNPLVDTGILGVNAGAGFGAALSVVMFNNIYLTYIFAFGFGILAVTLSYLTGRIYNTTPTVMLVLGGIVVSSVFVALLSFVKYLADPYDQLPTIVFWLMGSLARASYEDIMIAMIPMLLGILGLMLIRWRVNVISMGDREARTLGINVRLTKILVVFCTAMATAGAVCVSGTIGWIGLIIPHIGRMIVGNDNRLLLPTSLSLGASFLIIIDSLGRMLTGTELPLNILTALVGGPFFIYLLRKTKGGSW